MSAANIFTGESSLSLPLSQVLEICARLLYYFLKRHFFKKIIQIRSVKKKTEKRDDEKTDFTHFRAFRNRKLNQTSRNLTSKIRLSIKKTNADLDTSCFLGENCRFTDSLCMKMHAKTCKLVIYIAFIYKAWYYHYHTYEFCHEKTDLRGLRQIKTQTRHCSV